MSCLEIAIESFSKQFYVGVINSKAIFLLSLDKIFVVTYKQISSQLRKCVRPLHNRLNLSRPRWTSRWKLFGINDGFAPPKLNSTRDWLSSQAKCRGQFHESKVRRNSAGRNSARRNSARRNFTLNFKRLFLRFFGSMYVYSQVLRKLLL